MVKSLKSILLLLIVGIFFAGCSITMPVNATSNTIGHKVGTAKATGYLGVLFFDQDASIKTAAKNGGITKISTVDIKSSSILNLLVNYETVVTGE